MRSLRSDLEALAAFLWPGPCPACGGDLPPRSPAGVCPACWAALPARSGPGCRRCDLPAPADRAPRHCPDCRGARGPRVTVAAFVYSAGVVRLHRRLKFGGATELVGPFAERMVAAWRVRGPRGRPDLVVPVPPDPLRWGARRRVPGLLAGAVAARLELPCERALRKWRPTRPLTSRAGGDRRGRLAGAFRARRQLVGGRRVLVVDDVATTGATLREAARALAAAGAAEVFALVLARTPLG